MDATTKSKLNELVARMREAKALQDIENQKNREIEDALKEEIHEKIELTASLHPNEVIDKYGNVITLNAKQLEFVNLVGREGKSGVLIGAAGTGKTTSQFAVCQQLILSGFAGILDAGDHSHLISRTPGIVIVAYTRRAVANIRKNLPLDLQNNAITVHKLLEYQPVYYEMMDPESGKMVKKMQFEATRHEGNPLPSSIHTIVFEEGSMLGTDLYLEWRNASPHRPQEIFLGDIQQLPPVFGPAILGFKLLELPVVELTEVYRQALESPILKLAHRILSAVPIPLSEYPEWKFPGKLTIHPWKKKIEADAALNTAGLFFVGNTHTESDPSKQHEGALYRGYDPEEDMILMPFNKSFGTIELNNIIGNAIARRHMRDTYQIIAGRNKYHLSVGDKVLYDKEDSTILDIQLNPVYSGAAFIAHSPTLDYWGHDPNIRGTHKLGDDVAEFMLAQVAERASAEDEERVRAASHRIRLRMNDSEQEIWIDKASEINALLLGYALTVHKSQGSEWRKVFLVCHQSHATMLQRELLYTAVTRAREELYIICEPETFTKGILSQRVKGDTLAEKAEFFKGKIDAGFELY